MKPYYEEKGIVIYHGDCREILPSLPKVDLVLSDPPYPYQGEHFQGDIEASVNFATTFKAPRWLWFWDIFKLPPIPLPVVAKHIWYKSNTNRPNNYEIIYECANEDKVRGGRVFPVTVIHPDLTGCFEAVGHPTQKPERLMSALINLRRCHFLLDPFMGSGTTLRAAKNLGRKAIGIERDEHWCEVAAKRLSQEVLNFEAVA